VNGGAIRLNLRNRAVFPGLTNSAEDRHDRWTETGRLSSGGWRPSANSLDELRARRKARRIMRLT